MKKLKHIKNVIMSMIAIVLSWFIKRDKKMLAFGSWCGEMYIDNSKYLFEKALSTYGQDYRFVWIGNDAVGNQLPKDKRIIHCKKNSVKSIFYLLRSKYMFCSQFHFEDLSNINVYRGAVITYLHHGCPIKKLGDDAIGSTNTPPSAYDRITGRRLKFDYFVASSNAHLEVNMSSMHSWGSTYENNLKTGTPRNDILISATREFANEMKDKYAKILGFEMKKRVVLYVPTFRRGSVLNESLIFRDKEEALRLNTLLEKNDAVLVEKAHFVGSFGCDDKKSNFQNLISCPKEVNLQEMLLFTDCLVSDYSGAFLDYSLLNRPIINYLYDYEFYRDVNSGLYYKLEDFVAGPSPRTFDELCTSLDLVLMDGSIGAIQRKNVKARFMEYEKGNASEQILQKVVKN